MMKIPKLAPKTIEKIQKIASAYSNREVAERFGISETSVRKYRKQGQVNHLQLNPKGPPCDHSRRSCEDVGCGNAEPYRVPRRPNLTDADIKAALKKGPATLRELGNRLNTDDIITLECRVTDLALKTPISRRRELHLDEADWKWELLKDPAPGGQSDIILPDRGDGWSVLGFTSDNHLGSKHERLDVLNSLFDIYAAEGIQHVYQSGNWIEGESYFNRHDLKIFGLDNQINYFVDNWPERQGLTTHFVAGDDHEGWYTKREVIDIGKYAERAAKDVGRQDLHYLGYLEADVEVKPNTAAPGTPLKIMHGGGGNAYALSYTLQKLGESFQGGEKPSMVSLGHHHKFAYVYVRNIHMFMPGCTEDQSIFMRSRKIEAHVGGVIAWIKQDKEDGHIERCRIEWIPFYDKKYYETRFAVGLPRAA